MSAPYITNYINLLISGSDETSDLRDPAVEAGGLLHHVRQRVQGRLCVLEAGGILQHVRQRVYGRLCLLEAGGLLHHVRQRVFGRL